MANQTKLTAVKSEFDFVRAFNLDEGCGHRLSVTVSFKSDDYSKPLSVHFCNPDHDASVMVDWDLWQRVVAAVARAADQ